jgi:hypothetical protein
LLLQYDVGCVPSSFRSSMVMAAKVSTSHTLASSHDPATNNFLFDEVYNTNCHMYLSLFATVQYTAILGHLLYGGKIYRLTSQHFRGIHSRSCIPVPVLLPLYYLYCSIQEPVWIQCLCHIGRLGHLYRCTSSSLLAIQIDLYTLARLS